MAHYRRNDAPTNLAIDATSQIRREHAVALTDTIDASMGFERFDSGPPRVGWLVNFQATSQSDPNIPNGKAAVDFYFIDDEGGCFKSTIRYDPYFLVKCSPGKEADVEEYIRKNLEGVVKETRRVIKDDLSLPNHLIGRKQSLIEVRFWNVTNLLAARKTLAPFAEANQKKLAQYADYGADYAQSALNKSFSAKSDASDYILDIREYDVPYHVRVSIDLDVRVGKWYTVTAVEGVVSLTEFARIERADPVVLAFDIETTKQPLKFPDAAIDCVMMISYMINGEGYLITNREVVSKDIDDFEYTPKPEFKGEFTIFNEANERDLLTRFFDHIKEEKPTVIVTFNGDFFDWPFVDARANVHGINMYEEIGFRKDMEDEYKSAHCAHMDAFRWVKRDSYLPQGSQGLKAVTSAKLGYNPLELDPEKMTPYASEKPQVLAEYSVSDAVATYYLYMKYVHPFIFSLCNIIPLKPDEVLRKGTGTLCEMLLMVQAYQKGILLPHKHQDPLERFYNGHLVESETYVGGHVESLEAGVFRNDIPTHFSVDQNAIEQLLQELDEALKFTIQVEAKMDLQKVTNYDEIKQQITEKLISLKEAPSRTETPLIYHVDVASMYPNIMTTNRLQPDSMVSERDCAMCDFNRPGKDCDRRLPWAWRGEFYPAEKSEYLMIRKTLEQETFPRPNRDRNGKKTFRTFDELPPFEQAQLIKKRVSDYSRKVYHKIKQTETVEREAIICQRENPFYVNTVRDFRDRRYEFKGLQKVWKRKLDEVPKSDIPSVEEAKKMIVLYNSLQLAHKVILNSFYGYVMRKGSRWYSMEMAGVTCLTGATIIQLARSRVEQLGRPLELDTDGIWCILPSSFPGDFMFTFSDGKKLPIAYPCVMLNHLVHAKFTNHQYQILVDPGTFQYETISDNSIYFEVDGPYKAMVLPTSTEEGKNLKKRYAVFNMDGSLAELKGFELKRRGELRIIKAFQSQIFKEFLEGVSLEECYGAVAKVANAWLDVLDTRGKHLEDADLMDLISENKVMSKSLKDYAGQKSTSICTARRLAEFLGSQMIKDSGLACHYVISKLPYGAPVTDRAIPVEVFSAEYEVKRKFLRAWLKSPGLENFDPREIIDWDYYRARLASTIQKIITIPAALQSVSNPVPRVAHPDWLNKRVAAMNDRFKQKKITGFFTMPSEKSELLKPKQTLVDIEDVLSTGLGVEVNGQKRAVVHKRKAGEDDSVGADDLAVLEISNDTVAPDPEDDYSAWLRYQKVIWQKKYEQRETRRKLFGDKVSLRYNRGVTGMLRNQAEQAFSGRSWHIVQVTASPGKLGQVQAFIWVNSRIQKIKINVPRRFFVQFTDVPNLTLPSGITMEKSSKSLPHGVSNDNLYEVVMSEEAYQDELARGGGLLKQQTVKGVYETQLEPRDRVLLEIGTLCSLDSSRPGILGKGLESGFELEWLRPYRPRKGAEHEPIPYLKSTNLGYIFLQHYEISNQVFIAVTTSWSSKAYLVHYSASNVNANEPLRVGAMYGDSFTSLQSSDVSQPYFNFQENLEFDTINCSSLSKVYTHTNNILSDILAERGTHAVLTLQSARIERLYNRIRAIDDFASFEIKSRDGVLPSVGWQPALSKRIVKSYFRLQYWIEQLHSKAIFSNIPIGNLNSGDSNDLIDILFARKLLNDNVVLWWSNRPLPDLGGGEAGNVLANNEETVIPSFNNPGFYGKVCIDIDVSNLSVNSILTAVLFNAADGLDFSENNSLFGQNKLSASALSALSSLVKEWWSTAAKGDVVADNLIQHFITWVSSPQSKMYDPPLLYYVQNLSRKALLQLIGELHNFGARVVFADMNRLLVVTSNAHAVNTLAFGSFVIKSIKSNPLFTYLDVSIREYWDYLMWLDNANYCGRVCKPSLSETPELSHVSDWNIAHYLPKILEQEFQEWIFQLMQHVGEAKDLFHKDETRATQIAGTVKENAEESFTTGILKALEAPLVNRMKHLNRRYIDGRAIADVSKEFEFPKLAGSVANLKNPILELIKYICAVYGLGSSNEPEYLQLRRKLLEVVRVGEFDPDAQFRNPSADLVLNGIVCHNCGYTESINICRPELEHEFGWSCSLCRASLDRVFLEEKLVELVVKAVCLYQIQDLKCSKCSRIRADDMAYYCECSGAFVGTIPISTLRKDLAVYNHVSEFFDLKLLQSVLSGLN